MEIRNTTKKFFAGSFELLSDADLKLVELLPGAYVFYGAFVQILLTKNVDLKSECGDPL
jgi:hypothetical protein